MGHLDKDGNWVVDESDLERDSQATTDTTDDEMSYYSLDKQHLNDIAEEAKDMTEQGIGTQLSWVTPFNEPEPQRADYELNKEMLDKYFPYVSKEKEEEAAKKARQTNWIGRLGTAMASLGNLIGTAGFGAESQEIKPYTAPDIETWRKGLQTNRATRGTMEINADKQYHTAMDTYRKERLQNQTQNTKNLQQWNQYYFKNLNYLQNLDRQQYQEANRKFLAELNNNAKMNEAVYKATHKSGSGSGGGKKSGKPTNMDINIAWTAIPKEQRSSGRRGASPSYDQKLDDIRKYYGGLGVIGGGRSGGNGSGNRTTGSNGGGTSAVTSLINKNKKK